MVTFAISFIVGMAFGLYSGKKRAIGEGWGDVIKDLCNDICSFSKTLWRNVSGPFKSGKGGDENALTEK